VGSNLWWGWAKPLRCGFKSRTEIGGGGYFFAEFQGTSERDGSPIPERVMERGPVGFELELVLIGS